MRELVYFIATSLDGFIAGPDGDVSAFPTLPDTVAAILDRYPETCPAHLRGALGITAAPRRFDAVIMGAGTHQPALDAGLTSAYPHLRQYVVTHREVPEDPTVTVLAGDVQAAVAELKDRPGADIWLCGGADLAGQLIDQVDEIQVKVNPLLLGSGIRLVSRPYDPRTFTLTGSETLPDGVLLTTYRR